MLTLGDVLGGVPRREPWPRQWAALPVRGIEYDSRRARKDFLFFAFPGSRADGRQFARQAIAAGASAVASESPAPEGIDFPWIQVPHGRQALAVASRNFYGRPDERIHFTGITGTNGKTTTASLLDAILRGSGAVTAMLGTIEYRLGAQVYPAVNTTPESLDVMRLGAELEKLGGRYLTMEVSSHALALARIYGFHFHTAVFTNFTRDHLDFHGTMEEYAAAKRLLFAPGDAAPAPRFAVLNTEEPASQAMVAGSDSQTIWYGNSPKADLRAEKIRSGFDGLRFDMVYEGVRQPVESPLVGHINVANILAAAGAAISYGFDLPAIASAVRQCPAIPGRFERVSCGQPFLVVVDYAHTDDALRNVIRVARELTSGRVITLFGCGGDRDRTKRPLMGMAAAELSDFTVLTSDNPRSEDPLDIMNDVMVGLGRLDTPFVAEPDRAQAIRRAIEEARPGDVVLLAGKGHETYQIFKDRTIHFDDRETAEQILRSLGYEKSR